MTRATVHLEFDRSHQRLLRIAADGSIDVVKLTPLEHRLVEYMFARTRQHDGMPVVCSHHELSEAVWPNRDSVDARSALNKLVMELRRKIECNASSPALLTTIPNEGYSLAIQPFLAVRARSPFIVGLPVMEPARFFGRTRHIERLAQMWMRQPLHSAAVVGPPRSGKTSLLYRLRALARTAALRPGQRGWPALLSGSTERAPAAAAYRLPMISFQDPRTDSLDFVFTEVLRTCGFSGAEPCSKEAFTSILMTRLDVPTVVLIDDIDIGMARAALDDLWSTLASIACHHPHQLLAFVVACRRVPQGTGIGASQFLNIISEQIDLGPLSRSEAEELVASAPRTFSQSDVEWMLAESRGWPALLQIFCDTRLHARDATEDWKRHALMRAELFCENAAEGPHVTSPPETGQTPGTDVSPDVLPRDVDLCG